MDSIPAQGTEIQHAMQVQCLFNAWVGKIPGGRNGNPLLYYYLGNPMHGSLAGYRVAKRQNLATKQQQQKL